MSFKRNFFKNIITYGGYNYIGQALTFFSSVVMARLLVPSDYGFYIIIMIFAGFINMFTDAGLSYAVIRSDYGRTYHHALNNLSGLIGILLYVIMLILAYPISLFYDEPDLVVPTIVLSSIFIFNSLRVVPQNILAKKLDFNTIGQVNLLSLIVLIGSQIILAFLGFSYWALIISLVISDLFKCILFYKKAKFPFTFNAFYKIKVAFKKAKSLVKYLSIFNLIDYWTRTTDNLLIGKFYGTHSLGLYDKGYKLLQMSTGIITGIFGTVLFPSLKKHQSEGGDVNKEYEDILGIISLLSFPIALILMLIPKQLTLILWSETWIGAADFLPYFGVLILAQTLIFTTGNMFILLNKEKTFMYLGVIMSSFVVGSIIVGSLYSVLHIIRFYALFYLVVVIPIVLYVGFYKSFLFSGKRILSFWLPKLLLLIGLVFSVWFGTIQYTSILLGLYFIHLILYQRKMILAFLGILKNRILKISNK